MYGHYREGRVKSWEEDRRATGLEKKKKRQNKAKAHKETGLMLSFKSFFFKSLLLFIDGMSSHTYAHIG